MKKVMIIAALLLAGTTFAQGPEGRDPKEMAAKRAERMATELGLNTDQRTKLEAIFLHEAEQMKASVRLGEPSHCRASGTACGLLRHPSPSCPARRSRPGTRPLLPCRRWCGG